MARKGFVTRGNRQVRETLWLGIAAMINTLAGANNAVLMNTSSAAILALRPFTVIRTRGFIGIRSDQGAASESFDAAIGFSVVSDQALAIGVTAVPTPFTDQGSDMFFAYEALMGRFLFISGIGVDPGGLMPWIHYDSKAMRKVNDSQDIAFTLENSGVSAGVAVHHTGRMLVKLH